MQRVTFAVMVAGAIGVLVLQWLFVANSQLDAIPYSQFETLLAEGRVTEVTVSSDAIQGKVRDKLPSGKSAFVTARVDPALAERLAKKDVVVTGVPLGSSLLQGILGWVLPLLLFVLVWYWMSRGQGLGGFMSIGKSRTKVYAEKETKVRKPVRGGSGIRHRAKLSVCPCKAPARIAASFGWPIAQTRRRAMPKTTTLSSSSSRRVLSNAQPVSSSNCLKISIVPRHPF